MNVEQRNELLQQMLGTRDGRGQGVRNGAYLCAE